MNIDPRSGLTGQQVELLRGKLLAVRDQVAARARRRRPPAAMEDSEPQGDPADQAEATFEQSLLGTLGTADRQRLHDVDDAIARLDRGAYGVDETTGEPIGFQRLSVEPWARFTQDHQEQLEAAEPGKRPPSL